MTKKKDRKIASLYAARAEFQKIQFRDAVGEWHDLKDGEQLSHVHRIKPQTIEGAADEYGHTPDPLPDSSVSGKIKAAFIAGARWQKENE